MAKKQQQRKLELLSQLANTRLSAKHPKDLLLGQANLKGGLKGNVQSLALGLSQRVQSGVREKPKKAAIVAGVSALALTLLLKRKSSKKVKKEGKTVIKYLPEKKKKKFSRTVLKYAWALALPSIKSWATKKATRTAGQQIKTRAVKKLTQRAGS